VNAVIPKTREGRTVSAVIKSKICKESEYVVSPFNESEEVMAGKPNALKPWANTALPKSKKVILKHSNGNIFLIDLTPQH
jgi:hypothetical protein